MSKKKVSNLQRLIAFAMEVTEMELNQLSEVIGAIRDSRFPRSPAPAKRKPRVDKGKPRDPKPNGDSVHVGNAGEES